MGFSVLGGRGVTAEQFATFSGITLQGRGARGVGWIAFGNVVHSRVHKSHNEKAERFHLPDGVKNYPQNDSFFFDLHQRSGELRFQRPTSPVEAPRGLLCDSVHRARRNFDRTPSRSLRQVSFQEPDQRHAELTSLVSACSRTLRPRTPSYRSHIQPRKRLQISGDTTDIPRVAIDSALSFSI
jgi:hypothetical protein